MALRKACTPKGFSLIEITVVVGMFALVGGLALVMSMRSYGGYSFHTEKQLLVVALQKARSEALANSCIGTACVGGLPHGVHITQNQLTLFQGSAYDPADSANVYIPLENSKITLSGIIDVVFLPLTANVSMPSSIGINDAHGREATITVGGLGQISWDK